MLENIIHNKGFRIFAPIFYGLILYVLILLIFDTIEELSQNFFSIEVFVIIFLTYLLFGLMRWYIFIVDKKCLENCSIAKRILIQAGGCAALSLIMTSIIISFYFSKLVGFRSYNTELIVFNTIFLITSVLYNMVYFSFFYLNKINVVQLNEEDVLRKNMEFELDTFKNKINPGFLYDSLETLISLAKRDVNEADQFILKLSDIYRNVLSTKNNELSSIENELKVVNTLVEICNYKLNNNVGVGFENKEISTNLNLLSGTLVVIIEDIINRSIISDIQPLKINIGLEKNRLIISHIIQNKLIQVFSKKTEIEHVTKAYQHLGNEELSIHEEGNKRVYRIPVFKTED